MTLVNPKPYWNTESNTSKLVSDSNRRNQSPQIPINRPEDISIV